MARLGRARPLGRLVLAALLLSSCQPSKPPSSTVQSSRAVVLAVVGDYGYCAYRCSDEQDVAALIHSWSPDYIVTSGDNSYDNGTAPEVAADQWPYSADLDRHIFYPILGDHDYAQGCDGSAAAPSLAYFKMPAHYVAHLAQGLIDLYALDTNCGAPDGYTADSVQAQRSDSSCAPILLGGGSRSTTNHCSRQGSAADSLRSRGLTSHRSIFTSPATITTWSTLSRTKKTSSCRVPEAGASAKSVRTAASRGVSSTTTSILAPYA